MENKPAAPATGATSKHTFIIAPALLTLPPRIAVLLYSYAALLGGLIL